MGSPCTQHPPPSFSLASGCLPLDCLHSCRMKGRSFLPSPNPGLIYVYFRLPTTWGNGNATPTQSPVNSPYADNGTFWGLERHAEPLTVNDFVDTSAGCTEPAAAPGGSSCSVACEPHKASTASWPHADHQLTGFQPGIITMGILDLRPESQHPRFHQVLWVSCRKLKKKKK